MITEEFLAPMALTQGQFWLPARPGCCDYAQHDDDGPLWLDIAPTPGLKGPERQDLPSACGAVKFDGVNPAR